MQREEDKYIFILILKYRTRQSTANHQIPNTNEVHLPVCLSKDHRLSHYCVYPDFSFCSFLTHLLPSSIRPLLFFSIFILYVLKLHSDIPVIKDESFDPTFDPAQCSSFEFTYPKVSLKLQYKILYNIITHFNIYYNISSSHKNITNSILGSSHKASWISSPSSRKGERRYVRFSPLFFLPLLLFL